MNALREKARALLEAEAVKVVIGYVAGSVSGRSRPEFARTPKQAGALIFDESCRQNLAVYLLKPEVRALGKPAIVARTPTLRSLLLLAAENQLADGAVIALAVGENGEIAVLENFAAVEEYLAVQPRGLSAEAKKQLDAIEQLSPDDRWKYWREEFSRCLRCYACRAACPGCYCAQCVVDCNRPQWIPIAATDLGNLEWNVVRAMHLAGRCVDCGSCADACPAGIRLDLLNRVLASEAMAQFGAQAGWTRRRDYALSVYKPDDKEDFIR